MNELNKKEKKALADVVERANELEIVNEGMASISLKIGEVYHNIVKKYFATEVVIQFNYLEDLKKRTANVNTPEDFKAIVERDLKEMKRRAAEKPLTKIESAEYRMACKVYNDVCLGKGKDHDFSNIKINYDDQEIKFAGFFSPEELKKKIS